MCSVSTKTWRDAWKLQLWKPGQQFCQHEQETAQSNWDWYLALPRGYSHVNSGIFVIKLYTISNYISYLQNFRGLTLWLQIWSSRCKWVNWAEAVLTCRSEISPQRSVKSSFSSPASVASKALNTSSDIDSDSLDLTSDGLVPFFLLCFCCSEICSSWLSQIIESSLSCCLLSCNEISHLLFSSWGDLLFSSRANVIFGSVKSAFSGSEFAAFALFCVWGAGSNTFSEAIGDTQEQASFSEVGVSMLSAIGEKAAHQDIL